jgi:hypothetical protein
MATHLSMQHGPDSMVIVHQYLDLGAAPILTICAPDTHFVLTVADRGAVSATDLAFARSLAKAAADYLRHCEDLAAAYQRAEVPA